jgi:hypothetical protein
LPAGFDVAGQVFSPQIGFVIGTQSRAEHQRVIGVQCECKQPHHHAFFGL